MSDTARQIVVIPNLFTSFLATPPYPNPHYGSVRAESEQWLANSWQCDYKAQKKISAIDFSYFCAILAPKADHDRFRLICDWGNWVFPFDDLFDDGDLREDVDRAHLLIERLIGAMQDAKEVGALPAGAEAEQRLVDSHSNIWERLKSGTENAGVRERFRCAIQDYCNGALQQVQDCSASHSRDPEDLLTVRRSSIGAQPLYALVEFGHQLDIPKSVLNHTLIEQIRVLGVDLILIQNDILSYRKEEVSPSKPEESVGILTVD
jgi:hypothetical protein